MITIIDDKKPESDEEFEVKLKSNDPGVVSVNPDTATIKILDNDGRYSYKMAAKKCLFLKKKLIECTHLNRETY